MIKDLVRDEAVLSTPCKPATADDADLAQDLLDTMGAIDDCGCLAANQIGVAKAVVAYTDAKGVPHVMLNPRILMGLGASKAVEACLTREGASTVTRFDRVKVAYDEIVDGQLRQRRRDLSGWVGEMVQHMVDHCAGRLV